MRGLGYRPDPPDARDHDALKVIQTPSPPPSVPRSTLTKTLDQGGLGSCTVNAVAQAVRVAEIKQLVESGAMALDDARSVVEFLARLFPYYLARALHHETQVDSGTYIRFIFQVLNTFGFPPESAWPYDDDANPETGPFARMPSGESFRRAFDQRLAAEAGGSSVVKYSRIYGSGYQRVDNVRRALAEERLVVFGTQVSNEFCGDSSANGGRPIDPPTRDIAGGHAMVWGGYDETGADTLNSWSESFGDGGWFKMSWDYVASDMTHDLWIVERAPLISGGA